MKLRFDPFQIFSSSQTPVGLYARQKWLGEAKTSKWQADCHACVNGLFKNQSADGSWDQNPLTTIRRLFGLHLTLRSANRPVNTALDWLLAGLDQPVEPRIHFLQSIPEIDLQELPFVPNHPDSLLLGATLFLCTIFGLQDDHRVQDHYQGLTHTDPERPSWLDNWASRHNILRALVVHPAYADDDITQSAVERLAALQTEDGDWGNALPFFQTLNALAHLTSPLAEKQLEKAFRRVLVQQKSDGAFSQQEPEWNTFLTVHALKNKEKNRLLMEKR